MTEKLSTNLSVGPYFDDYNEADQYVRVLFVPSNAVQVRELNQIQTMAQAQISRFGGHVFKEGAVVDGVAVSYIESQPFVFVDNATSNNRVISAIANNEFVIVSSTGVRAVPRTSLAGFKSQYPQTNRLYIDYVASGVDGANNQVAEFLSGETLTVYRNQSKLGTLDSNNVYDSVQMLTQNTLVTNVTGVAYALSATPGTIFQKGFFLKTDPQYVLVNPLNQNTENLTVGFTTREMIINEDMDGNLFDNAAGSPNQTAPGAHRLKLVPQLISIDKTTLTANSTFYPIVEFGAQSPAENNAQNEIYNILGEQLARRTDEESGNYVAYPFTVESTATSNTQTMKYEISAGVGYVRGHRIELIGTKTANVSRATETKESQAEIITANLGNYLICDELVGTFDGDFYGAATIYDAAQNSLSEVEGANAAPSGNAIGTLNVRAVLHEIGTKGTFDCRYRIYVTAIKMNSGKSFVTNAKSIYMNGTYGKAKADMVLNADGKAVLIDSTKDSLVFPIGMQSIKRLTDINGVNDTQFVYRDTVTGTLQANGYVTFSTNTPYAGGNERLNSSVGFLSDSGETRYDVTLSAAAYTANRAGTVTATGNTVVIGSGTSFLTSYVPGGFIRFGNGDVRNITSIANNTYMTVNANETVSANTHAKYWPDGSVIDLTGSGATVQILSNTQFSIAMGETIANGSQAVRATFPVLRTQAVAAKKEIKKDRFVKINCATAGVGGVYDLGITDVVSVSFVYVGTTYSDTNPDQSAWFTYETGQTSYEYGHGVLKVLPQFKEKLNTNTRILVQLDHFTANTSAGAGFFSVDSYPFIREGEEANTTNIAIAGVNTVQGYDVRDVIDFRPYRYNTANSAATPAEATENPAVANSSYSLTSAGSLLIEPDQNFQADLEYYLPRYDLITMSKAGDIIVRRGTPAVYPIIPKNEMDTMSIATVYVPGFPTLTTREQEQFGRSDLATRFNLVTNRRYTMENIGALEKRIQRLEYYVTLNALEQSARDMTVLDSNGLDRFKNGIFADTFNSHLIGRADDFEYKIAIDRRKAEARPTYKTHNVDFIFDEAASVNIAKSGRQISLAYSPEPYVAQPYASKYRNCNENIWKWNGRVILYPTYDQNVDTINAPALNVTVDNYSGIAGAPFSNDYGEWDTTNQTKDTTKDVKNVGNNGNGGKNGGKNKNK